jgi:hypothetical protein
MDAANDIQEEMLPIRAAFICAAQMGSIYLCCPCGQHFFADILCCIHIFCPQKTHNATLFYRGTCIQERHLVTAATSVQYAHTDRCASQ